MVGFDWLDILIWMTRWADLIGILVWMARFVGILELMIVFDWYHCEDDQNNVTTIWITSFKQDIKL
jgi:hypothetical protein